MDRREFLELVITATVASRLPLDKAFAQVTRETNYLDGLIVSMEESLDKRTILVKTSRWFSMREAFDIKHAWLDQVYGNHFESAYNDMRDVHIISLTDKKPENAVLKGRNPDGFLSERSDGKWFADNADGSTSEVCGDVKVIVLKPEPSVLSKDSKEWTDSYEEVDGDVYEGGPDFSKDLSHADYSFYHLGPEGSSALAGVYEDFEEWLWTRDSGIDGVLEVGIEKEYEQRLVDYCVEKGIQHRRLDV